MKDRSVAMLVPLCLLLAANLAETLRPKIFINK